MATPAKAPSNITKFLSYAAENKDVLINADNFMAWDGAYNNFAEKEAIEHEYGKAAIYAIGLKELFGRRLNNALRFSIPKGNVVLPAGVPRTSVTHKGIPIDRMTAAQQDYRFEDTKRRWQNDSRRLKLLGLTTAKLHKLLDEALQD